MESSLPPQGLQQLNYHHLFHTADSPGTALIEYAILESKLLRIFLFSKITFLGSLQSMDSMVIERGPGCIRAANRMEMPYG